MKAELEKVDFLTFVLVSFQTKGRNPQHMLLIAEGVRAGILDHLCSHEDKHVWKVSTVQTKRKCQCSLIWKQAHERRKIYEGFELIPDHILMILPPEFQECHVRKFPAHQLILSPLEQQKEYIYNTNRLEIKMSAADGSLALSAYGDRRQRVDVIQGPFTKIEVCNST